MKNIPNTSIRKRDGKRGTTFKIEVYLGYDAKTGKRFTESTTYRPKPGMTEKQIEKDLRRFAIEYEQRVNSGLSNGDTIRFDDFAAHWMEVYAVNELEKSTYRNYQGCLRNMILPRLGHFHLSDIKPLNVQAALNDMKKTGYDYGLRKGQYAPDSIRTAKIIISSLLSAAVEAGHLSHNPCIRQRKRKRDKAAGRAVKCWNVEQAIIFMDAIKKPIPVIVDAHTSKRGEKIVKIRAHRNKDIRVALKYQALFILEIFSGLRRGEVLALRWRDIDFSKNTIRICKAVGHTTEDGVYEKEPKSGSGNRTIYLPAAVMDLLKALRHEQKQTMMKLGSAWKGSRTIDDNYLFTRSTGELMGLSTPRRELSRLIKAYNRTAEESKKLPEISFHGLRHTHASILVSTGLDLKTISSRLGHSDPTITLAIYSHSFEERDRAASDAIENILMPKHAIG